jgi:small basic protein (TIGR04137 family)
MSIDRSLKSSGGLIRHRNVLTRAERITRLKREERFGDGENSAFGLPKVANRNVKVGKKTKTKKEEATAEAPADAKAEKKPEKKADKK